MSTDDDSSAPILMYARKRYCPDVERARAVLKEYGLPWTGFDVESDAEALPRMHAPTGRKNVPTLLIGSTVLVEPSGDEIDTALKSAGFLQRAR
ncbi:MAG TPA: glutaredoxin family protein [Thermomicrobiales bacterium]|nr:glutaredoxin family protein [Thermomicrobiales bacterium]